MADSPQAPARPYAAAARKADLRPASPDSRARRVTGVDGVYEFDVEHALDDQMTLCGLPRSQVEVMRHLWSPDKAWSCSACARTYADRHGGPPEH